MTFQNSKHLYQQCTCSGMDHNRYNHPEKEEPMYVANTIRLFLAIIPIQRTSLAYSVKQNRHNNEMGPIISPVIPGKSFQLGCVLVLPLLRDTVNYS